MTINSTNESLKDAFALMRTEPWIDHIGDLQELLSQSKRVFLLGAGCSKSAGLPLMGELTDLVIEKVSGDTSAVVADLHTAFDKTEECTIEDLMSELVDHISIAKRRASRKSSNTKITINENEYESETLEIALRETKESIASIIKGEKENRDISAYRDFVGAIHGSLQSGKKSFVSPVDYFTLNYDTLLEDALSLQRVIMTDGFEGGTTAWWNPKIFSVNDLQARVFKLHGSIDWCMFDGEVVPSRVREGLSELEGNDNILIWPAATKYIEAQKDPFAQLIGHLRKALRPQHSQQTVLFISGYSFGDEHINDEIIRALQESDDNLTVVATTSDDAPVGEVKKWLNDSRLGKNVRVFANKGVFHGDNHCEADSQELPWWQFEILSKLLGGI